MEQKDVFSNTLTAHWLYMVIPLIHLFLLWRSLHVPMLFQACLDFNQPNHPMHFLVNPPGGSQYFWIDYNNLTSRHHSNDRIGLGYDNYPKEGGTIEVVELVISISILIQYYLVAVGEKPPWIDGSVEKSSHAPQSSTPLNGHNSQLSKNGQKKFMIFGLCLIIIRVERDVEDIFRQLDG